VTELIWVASTVGGDAAAPLVWGFAPALFMPSFGALMWAVAALLFMATPALAQETTGTEPEPPPEEAAPPEQPPEPSPEPSAAPETTAPEPEAAAPQPELQTIPVQAEEQPVAPSRDAVQLDTIEVTSDKRIKSQRDIPGSVAAIRGQDLEKIRAQGMADFMKLVPGVVLTDRGSGQQIVTIRGITSSTAVLGAQFTALTTGLYLDEMPFNDLFVPLLVPDLNPFDLERVEVLKGPQGTLFGASALAGAVRYIFQKPEFGVWKSKVQSTVMDTKLTGDPSWTNAAALNVPIGDSIALRGVGLYRERSGLYDVRPQGSNTRNEDNVDSLEQVTGRILASWDVNERLKTSAFWFQQNATQPELNIGSQNRERYRPERNDVPFPSELEQNFGGGNLVTTYDFDAMRLLYTGNYLDKYYFNEDHNERGLLIGNQQQTTSYNLIRGKVNGSTHELRVMSPESGDAGDWDWLAGVAYMSYRQNVFQYFDTGDPNEAQFQNPPRNPDDVPPADQLSSVLWAVIDGDGTEKAVFGEATRRLGDYWEATLGLRWFDTQLLSSTILRGAEIMALFPGATEKVDKYDARERGLNPKASLRYLHNQNVQAYVLAAKGYQFGGFQLNPPVVGLQAATERRGFTFGPYKSSDLWNYEVGIRTEWLDRRLRFDVAAFYLDWKDLQLTVTVPVNPRPIPVPGQGDTNVGFGVIVNVGRAHSEGLEVALQALPFSGAVFTTTATWVSALTDEAFDHEAPQGPVPAGTRLPAAPRFQWANQFAYEHALPFFTEWTGGFQLTYAFIGEAPNSIRPQQNVGGYGTLDGRVTLATQRWAYVPEIGIGVNNITDTRGVTSSGGAANSSQQSNFFIQPRTTLLTLGWDF
jgi:outer membrane receptor protein involved in Fe transport